MRPVVELVPWNEAGSPPRKLVLPRVLGLRPGGSLDSRPSLEWRWWAQRLSEWYPPGKRPAVTGGPLRWQWPAVLGDAVAWAPRAMDSIFMVHRLVGPLGFSCASAWKARTRIARDGTIVPLRPDVVVQPSIDAGFSFSYSFSSWRLFPTVKMGTGL